MNSNNPDHVTVVKESSMGTVVIAMVAILAILFGAWYFMSNDQNVNPADADISAAANKVGAAADKVGDAAQDSAKKVN